MKMLALLMFTCSALATSALPALNVTEQPCTEEDTSCPHAPCPAPPPGCEADPNPLVINSFGQCCQESLCTSWNCPSHCQTDGGSSYAESNDHHYYDCSRSATAKECFDFIDPEASGKENCKCLLTDCLTSAAQLRPQPSACTLACRQSAMTGAGICPDWDDNHDLCNYYASFYCVATSSECKPALLLPLPTPREVKCIESPPPSTINLTTSPEDNLDRFLRCITS